MFAKFLQKARMFFRKFKLTFASLAGNFIEYYDYSLYGFLAAQINAHFFPPSDDHAPTFLKVYGVFLLGFLSRPIGSILLSYLGDTKGRKLALCISILGVCGSTLLIGFLPSYQKIGMWSLFVLIIARVVQGACISGEGDGVRVFVMEHFGSKRYCLASGFAGLSSSGGIFAAAYLASFVNEGIFNWQWLFVLGGLLSLVVFLLRHSIQETPEFEKSLETEALSPSPKTLIPAYKKLMVIMALLSGSVGGVYYFLAIFSHGFFWNTLGILSQQEATTLSNTYLLGYALLTIPLGYLADRYDPIKWMTSLTVGLILLYGVYLMLVPVAVYQPALFFVFGLLTLAVIIPIMPTIMTLVPVRNRYRVVSIGHAFGAMTLGGTAPFVGSALHYLTNDFFITLLYPVLLLSVNLVALFLLKSARFSVN